MKLIFSISFILIATLGVCQKVTLTIQKDTLDTFDTFTVDEKYNGFYATEYEQVVVNIEGSFITLKARCFMEVKNDSCWIIQENISVKTAKKLYKKESLFKSKNVIIGCFKFTEDDSKSVKNMGKETKVVYYLNLFQLELGKFYRSTSIKNSDNFKVFFNSNRISKSLTIGMPVHVKAEGTYFPPNGIYTAIYYTFVKID